MSAELICSCSHERGQLTRMYIPKVDARALFDSSNLEHEQALQQVRVAAMDIGFMTLHDTLIDARQVEHVFENYHRFFKLDVSQKTPFNMVTSHSNRGWGASGAEQVNPDTNPDYKEVFDSGLELTAGDSGSRWELDSRTSQPRHFHHQLW